MRTDEIIVALADENPEALMADGFEDALIGIAYRCGQKPLAVYSMRRAIRLLVERDGMSESDAEEYLEFNVLGAWNGENTPIFLVAERGDGLGG